MTATAAKRTVFAAVSVLLFAAICIAGPAGGAQSDRIRPNAPTNPHVTAATPTSATIAWNASADNVAVVGYDVFLGTTRTRVTGTSHALRKLACGSAFAVAVAAVDAAGNRSRKTSVIAASAACADSARPSVPTGFRQAATSGDAVVLTWQPSNDDAGVVAYGVYDEFARISLSSESTATLTGLACGATEVVSVDAVDAAGNRSARRQVYVETSDCPSTQAMPVYSATASTEWTLCALEHHQCSFPGTAEVRYGANETWTGPRSFTGGVACANSVFGDPLWGVRKRCEFRSHQWTPPQPTNQWTYCAHERVSCVFSGSREVRFGANGTWTAPRTFTNGVSCANGVFGDPLVGVVKSCHTRATLTATAPAPPAADKMPPAKPVLSIGAVGRNTATLNWQPGVDNVGVDHYAVWLDGSLVTRTTSTSHTYAGLECDTPYVLGLQVVDAAGNTSVLTEALWPIRPTACSSTTTIDRQVPTTPAGLSVASATQTSVRLGWSASTDNVGVTGYDVDREGTLATTVATPGATVGGLTCGRSYGFGVKAFDAAGNRSSAASVVGSTSPCSDTQAPTAPTNVTASSRTASSIALSWSAATDDTGVVGYGLYRGGVLTGTTSSAPGIFAGLTCNTNYTLAVDAYDASGNRSPRVTIAAGTTACPDTTPPSTPTGLAASGVTQAGLTLNWSASTDGVGVAGYDVFRAGTKVATTTTTTSNQTGLACGTSYGFSVQAFDAAGNRSGQASLTVVTTACASSPSPPPTGAALAVSTSGADSTCVRGDISRPCATFNRAYQLSQCGDAIDVRGGTYGDQKVYEVASLSSCAVDVTFRPQSGAAVTVNRIDLGTVAGYQATDAPDRLTLKNMKLVDGIAMYGDATHVTLDGIDGGSFFIGGGRNITIRNGDWGPCKSSGDSLCETFFAKQIVIANSGATSDITLEGNVIHDFDLTGAGDHYECIRFDGVTNLTVRGNRFYNCEIYAMTMTDWRGMTLIENNWFQSSCCGRASSLVLSDKMTGTVAIRFNSFGPGQGIVDEGGRPSAGVITAVGNIFGGGSCHSVIQYAYNVWAGGTPCSSTDTTVAGLPYANASGGATGDFRLASGLTAADNRVPANAPHSGLGVDFDGHARTAPRDAGADER